LPDRPDDAFAVWCFESSGGSRGTRIWALLQDESGNFSRRLLDRAVALRSGVAWVLSYLVKVTLTGGKYSVFGYKGKQVRDNIHSHDVVRAIEEFAAKPRLGEVYNLGGGRAKGISMLEAIERIEQMTGRKLDWRYVNEARKGDHICYISNLGKFQSHYPNWKITRGVETILEEIIASQRGQLAQTSAG
jgi:nucleoside-diphosphate-sugar epimerase